MMTRRQLYALFICSLVPSTIGNGLLPLLPIYASKLGASPQFVGLYMASSYVALAAGNIGGGWLADRLQRRKWQLVLCTGLAVPVTLLMGQVTDAWQLLLVTFFIWGSTMLGAATTGILAGLTALPEERGRVFGILAMTPALGSLLGGALFGVIVDAWGYATLFGFLALLGAIQPIAGLFLEEPPPLPRTAEARAAQAAPLDSTFYLLLAVSLMAGISLFVGRMGTSLSMHGRSFSATAISSTMAVGGLVTLPLALYAGRLSDRIGRRLLLSVCYSGAAAGLFLLAVATSLWQFWAAAALLSISSYIGGGIGSALVTDIVPKAALGKGIALFQTSSWIGGIIGFAAAGVLIEHFGMAPSFLAVGATLLLSITLCIPRPIVAPAAASEP